MAGKAFIDDLGADLRYALRTMRRTPGFTLAAVVSLAAAVVPARRAASVDPLVALRSD